MLALSPPVETDPTPQTLGESLFTGDSSQVPYARSAMVDVAGGVWSIGFND